MSVNRCNTNKVGNQRSCEPAGYFLVPFYGIEVAQHSGTSLEKVPGNEVEKI